MWIAPHATVTVIIILYPCVLTQPPATVTWCTQHHPSNRFCPSSSYNAPLHAVLSLHLWSGGVGEPRRLMPDFHQARPLSQALPRRTGGQGQAL